MIPPLSGSGSRITQPPTYGSVNLQPHCGQALSRSGSLPMISLFASRSKDSGVLTLLASFLKRPFWHRGHFTRFPSTLGRRSDCACASGHRARALRLRGVRVADELYLAFGRRSGKTRFEAVAGVHTWFEYCTPPRWRTSRRSPSRAGTTRASRYSPATSAVPAVIPFKQNGANPTTDATLATSGTGITATVEGTNGEPPWIRGFNSAARDARVAA